MLGNLFGESLGGFFGGQVRSSLSGSVGTQTINVNVSRLELMRQFSEENSHADAVERDDEDLAAV